MAILQTNIKISYYLGVLYVLQSQALVVWFTSDNLWPCTELFVLFLNSIRCALSWFATIYSRGRSSKEWYTIQTLLYILISFVAVTRCGILLHRMLGSPRLLLYLTRALIQSWVAVDAWQVVELQWSNLHRWVPQLSIKYYRHITQRKDGGLNGWIDGVFLSLSPGEVCYRQEDNCGVRSMTIKRV